MTDLFPYFWLLLVATMGAVSLLWGINDLKVGSARMSFYSARVDREEEPFEYWLAVGSKFLAVPVTIFMFTMGLQILDW